jgi:hypothetical protein
VPTSVTERKACGDATDPETSAIATRVTSRTEKAGDVEVISQKGTIKDVSDELFDGLDFDDRLSQEIRNAYPTRLT